jgi:transposase
MSHMTLLMGPERRRRWNDDIREQILAEAFSPGATVADVARRFQVSTSLIYKWRRASLLPPAPMGFAPAVLVEEVGRRSGAEGPGFAIVVELPGGARVSLAANASAVLVAATLKGLR